MNQRLVATIQLLTVVVAGAFVAVLAKLALSQLPGRLAVPPFTFVWLQIAIGGTLLTAYTFLIRGERIPRKLSKGTWGCLIWIGVCNFAIVRVFFFLSLEALPVTTHVYLINFVGLVTMLMSVAILREWPSGFQVLGAVIAISGLRVFFTEIPPPERLVGVVYVAIGVTALASTNNVTRKLRTSANQFLSNNIISTVALWIGGIPVVLCGFLFDWPPPVFGWQNWTIIAASGVVSIAVGLTVFNYVLRTLRSYEASIFASTSVLFVAVFAVPVLGEKPAVHQLFGIGITLLGLALVQFRRGMLGFSKRSMVNSDPS